MLATHPQNLDKDCVGIYKVKYAPIERTLLPTAALVERRRYLIVVPRPLPAAPRRYLIVVPRPMSAAPHLRYFVVVPRPLPAAALVVRRRYLVVVRALARGAAALSAVRQGRQRRDAAAAEE
jgi:hypothetical protein